MGQTAMINTETLNIRGQSGRPGGLPWLTIAQNRLWVFDPMTGSRIHRRSLSAGSISVSNVADPRVGQQEGGVVNTFLAVRQAPLTREGDPIHAQP